MSKLTSPSINLSFLGGDVSPVNQTIGNGFIVKGSIKVRKQMLNGLKSSSSSVSLSIAGNCQAIKSIMASHGDVKAILKDGDSTIFTGYLSGGYKWTVDDHGEDVLSITIEDVGTRLLGATFIDRGEAFFNVSVSVAVQRICAKAGITIAHGTVFPDYVATGTVDDSVTCRDILDGILYESGYCYYFNEDGNLCIFEIDCSSTQGIPVCSDLIGSVSVNKSLRKHSSARITYSSIESASDYLVYRNTTGQDGSHPYCHQELKAGEAFDGLETFYPDGIRQSALVEACNALSETEIVGSNEIIAVSNVTVDLVGQTSAIEASIVPAGGKFLQILAKNNGNIPLFIDRLDAKADIIFKSATNVIRTEEQTTLSGGSSSLLEEEMEWIHDDTAAKRHANLIASYYRYCGTTYTFRSRTAYNAGSIVELKENVFAGLDVAVMITTVTESDSNDIYEYSAVGISEFNLDGRVISQTIGAGTADNVNKPQTVKALYIDASTTTVESNRRIDEKETVTFTATKLNISGDVQWFVDGASTASGTGDTFSLEVSINDSISHVVEAVCGSYSNRVIIHRFLIEEPEYIGIHSQVPAQTPEGNNLLDGDIYFDSSTTQVYKYSSEDGWNIVSSADENWFEYAAKVVGDANFPANADFSSGSIVTLYCQNIASNKVVANLLKAREGFFDNITVAGSSRFLGQVITEPFTTIINEQVASVMTNNTPGGRYAMLYSDAVDYIRNNGQSYTTASYGSRVWQYNSEGSLNVSITKDGEIQILKIKGIATIVDIFVIPKSEIITEQFGLVKSNIRDGIQFIPTEPYWTENPLSDHRIDHPAIPAFAGTNIIGNYTGVTSIRSLSWNGYRNGEPYQFAGNDASMISYVNCDNGYLEFDYNGVIYRLDSSIYLNSISIDIDVSAATVGIRCMDIIPKNNQAYNLGTSSAQFLNVWASKVNETSKREFKKNIQKFDGDAISLLSGINVVSFVLRNDADEEHRVGFIAEDTDEILAGKNHDKMDTGNCIGILIKAIQELTARNATLEAEIDAIASYLIKGGK